jgi:hypothetical protein
MTTNKTLYVCALISGIILLLSTIPHSTGIKMTMDFAKKGVIGPDYADTAVVIWIFASMMMIVCGSTILYLAGKLKKSDKGAWRLGLLIGVLLAAFGITVFVSDPTSYPMLVFITVGLLLVVPLLIFSRRF